MPVPWFLRTGFRKGPAALALGGGGARGLAHVGVLRVMEEEGGLPDLIVGTSIGAVIGGMYAQQPDINALQDRLLDFLQSPFFKSVGLEAFHHQQDSALFPLLEEWIQGIRMRLTATRALTHEGMVPARVLREGIDMLLDDTDIADCRVPFACVAVDLHSGETRTLRRGSIRQAVAASSSIPGIIAPTVIDGRLLVDGAVTSAIPVLEARDLGARTVVAVDVGKSPADETSPKVGFEIMQRAGEIAASRCNEQQIASADLLLRPTVRDYHWARFDLADSLIAAGTKAAQPHVRRLRAVFHKTPSKA